MKSISSNRILTALFLMLILCSTFFSQNTALRKKYFLFANSDCFWALKTPQNSAETKKQTPISTIIEEEEDKIVEEIKTEECKSSPILISLTYSFQSQFFEEPFLKVRVLPPWA